MVEVVYLVPSIFFIICKGLDVTESVRMGVFQRKNSCGVVYKTLSHSMLESTPRPI
jgi:hypothetical protein